MESVTPNPNVVNYIFITFLMVALQLEALKDTTNKEKSLVGAVSRAIVKNSPNFVASSNPRHGDLVLQGRGRVWVGAAAYASVQNSTS